MTLVAIGLSLAHVTVIRVSLCRLAFTCGGSCFMAVLYRVTTCCTMQIFCGVVSLTNASLCLTLIYTFMHTIVSISINKIPF